MVNSNFCVEMVNQVLLKELNKGSNCVLSPLSFHLMLNLIAAGSKGLTLEQLLSCLGSETVEDLNRISSEIVALTEIHEDKNSFASPIVSFANGLWVDQQFSLKPSFRKVVEEVYKAKAEEVDFTKADFVVNEVNSWVENATNGLINELLPRGSLDSNTSLVFANALYFKGAWNRRFDKELTKNCNFHLLNKEAVQVPFMAGKESERHLYASLDGYKILQIPYQNGEDSSQFSMYFFLPNEIGGLPKLLEKFIAEPGMLNKDFKLQMEKIPVLLIPKFKFSFEFEASGALKEMGLEKPFMNLGEFTEMVDSRQGDKLYLSQVFHKSYIEVNEDGTEAAASTAGRVRKLARVIRPSFVADHPFLFMIKEERSGVVFFTGVLLNPLLAS